MLDSYTEELREISITLSFLISYSFPYKLIFLFFSKISLYRAIKHVAYTHLTQQTKREEKTEGDDEERKKREEQKR
nr:hypothetical protein [Paeniclostridium ghonii]